MPKLACNGFSMFANHWRGTLEAARGAKFAGMEQLIAAANPLWAQASEAEKREWKERAKEYRKTREFRERARASRRRAGRTSSPLRPTSGLDHLPPPLPNLPPPNKAQRDNTSPNSLDDDPDSDFDPGVPMIRGLSRQRELAPTYPMSINGKDTSSAVKDARAPGGPLLHQLTQTHKFLHHKLGEDKTRLRNYFQDLLGKESGSAEAVEAKIKQCRWLLVSVEAYAGSGDLGQPTGTAAPAELALIEWDLSAGILEEYFRILGPWTEELSPTEMGEARSWAERTHGIPVEGLPEAAEWTGNRRRVLRNVLGRMEPALAAAQGLRMGLYTKEGEVEKAVLPGDEAGRRWLIVGSWEWEAVVAGLGQLGRAEGLSYEGLQGGPERVILAEALVSVLAELCEGGPSFPSMADAGVGGDANAELRILGNRLRWDPMPAMYCSFHAPSRNPHCAIATARKSLFAVFAILKDPFHLPFHF